MATWEPAALVKAKRGPTSGGREWYSSFAGGSHEFRDGGELVLEDQTMFHFGATGITPAMARPQVGTGWVGLPRAAVMYILDSVEANDGAIPHAVTVSDVPVDAFWSVTIYNADGYLEANDRGVNSDNDFTAEPNADGSFTLHFGGCDDGRLNCIPITPGWNYAIRLYEPRSEILEGQWSFSVTEPAS
ncbi:MAG: DUF1214 domain-containing protein [Hyphomicrobiales bacterium]|nr:DUF1214 domain-containing protein [Hyphomicrobiales bacterium]